ncbi:hypothetical protein BMS3Bbin11_00263 [bacterium BMS3Bbin11]|nr:hypothetical protein BMS3Bbin11_00263 [bacterium BMS3Bbin11]
MDIGAEIVVMAAAKHDHGAAVANTGSKNGAIPGFRYGAKPHAAMPRRMRCTSEASSQVFPESDGGI